VETLVVSAEERRSIELRDLPIGEHAGIWGGYEVTFSFDGKQYLLKTKSGIRTMGAKCVVKVTSDSVVVEAA